MRINWNPFIIAVALVAASCQSAKVATFHVDRAIGRSHVVCVEPFDVSHAQFIGDQGNHNREEVRDRLTSELVTYLNRAGRDARATRGSDAPADAMLVRGSIDLIDAGSGTTRALWGFGAGQSKLTCNAEILNLAESASAPAATVRVVGGTHGKGGWQAAGYPCFADAGDAAEQIAKFIEEHR